MTKVVKTKTLKTGKPAGKVVKPKVPAVTAASQPRYYKPLDLLMAAVSYAKKGQPNRAVKALADAAQDPDIDLAMQQLNDQQQQALDADQDFAQDDLVIDQDDTAQMSKTLARLMRNSQKAETAAADDEEDDEDDEEDESDEDDEEDDEQSEESSTAETAGEDGEQSDDDLDISVDEDDEDQEQEQQVQASVTARLQRAARNKSRRP